MYSKISNPVRFANTGAKVVINPHLSSTPSQMHKQIMNGLPIGNQVDDGSYFEGTEDVTFDIPVAFKRGIDIAEAWEASMDARSVKSKIGKLINQQNIQTNVEQVKTQ